MRGSASSAPSTWRRARLRCRPSCGSEHRLKRLQVPPSVELALTRSTRPSGPTSRSTLLPPDFSRRGPAPRFHRSRLTATLPATSITDRSSRLAPYMVTLPGTSSGGRFGDVETRRQLDQVVFFRRFQRLFDPTGRGGLAGRAAAAGRRRVAGRRGGARRAGEQDQQGGDARPSRRGSRLPRPVRVDQPDPGVRRLPRATAGDPHRVDVEFDAGPAREGERPPVRREVGLQVLDPSRWWVTRRR